MNGPQIRALIQGYINIDSTAKQQIGRSFAVYLGLKPGEIGSDDGIDGMGFVDGLKIYFQSKLSKNNLGVDKADEFYANLKFHQANIGVMLAGVGYTSGFKERLFKQPDIANIKIHLLTLEDIFAKTPTFKAAIKDLPPLDDSGQNN